MGDYSHPLDRPDAYDRDPDGVPTPRNPARTTAPSAPEERPKSDGLGPCPHGSPAGDPGTGRKH